MRITGPVTAVGKAGHLKLRGSKVYSTPEPVRNTWFSTNLRITSPLGSSGIAPLEKSRRTLAHSASLSRRNANRVQGCDDDFRRRITDRASRCGSWTGGSPPWPSAPVQLHLLADRNAIEAISSTNLRARRGTSNPPPPRRRGSAARGLASGCFGAVFLAAWRSNELARLREVFLQYKAATLAVDFADFGAVHRGLGGSLARMFTSDAVDAAIAFHFASAFGVASSSRCCSRGFRHPSFAVSCSQWWPLRS